MATRLFFWALAALVLTAVVIVLGASVAPEGSPFHEIFQSILDSVGAAWGNI